MPSSNTRSVTGMPSCSSRSVLYVGSHTRTTERALCLLSSWNRTAVSQHHQHHHQLAGHQLINRQAIGRLLMPGFVSSSQSAHIVRWNATSPSTGLDSTTHTQSQTQGKPHVTFSNALLPQVLCERIWRCGGAGKCTKPAHGREASDSGSRDKIT